MKVLAVDGQMAFDKFNATIPAADGKGPPRLIVEEVKGQIPFKQAVLLPDLKQLKAKSKASAVAAASVATDKTAASAPQGAPATAAKATEEIAEVPLRDD